MRGGVSPLAQSRGSGYNTWPMSFFATIRAQLSVALLACAAFVVLAPAAEATVRVMTRPDGRKVIVDDKTPRVVAGTVSSRLRSPSGEVADLIDYYAHDRGLSPRLVQAVIQVESAFNERARSHKGAMGLMQLMPDTARLLRVSNPYDPAQNIRGGTLYLRRQLDRFDGDLTLALAAYNAGPAAVSDYGGVPPYPETRNYVRKVLSLYRGEAAATPAVYRERSRDPAASETRALPEPPRLQGQKVYMSRGKNNRIVFTSAPPRTP